MKNNYPQLSALKHYLFLAIIIICFNYGCRKENHTTDITAPAQVGKINADIPVLQDIYNTATKSGNIGTFSTATPLNLIHTLTVDWNTYTLQQRSDSSIVAEFSMPKDSLFVTFKPYRATDDTRYGNKTSAVFIKFSNGKRLNFFMKVVEEYTASKSSPVLKNFRYGIVPKTFTGSVFYYTLDKKFLNGYNYKNGALAGTIQLSASPNIPQQQQQQTQAVDNKLKVNQCDVSATPIYGCDSYSWYDTDGNILGTAYHCDLILGYNITTTGACGGGGGTGGGGTGGGGAAGDPGTPPPVPCVPATPPVVESVQNGRLTVNQLEGGGGSAPVPCPTASSNPIFGLNNSNTIVPDNNFDNLLNYLDTQGIPYTDPYNVTYTVNGVNYSGQFTDIKNPDGSIGHYFSPDISIGPFQIGMEYYVGTSGESSNTINTSSNSNLNGVVVTSPSSYLGNGTGTYLPSGGGGGGILTLAQRQQLENADNNRLLQLLQQEDAADDATAGPCHGTARNGNVQWPGTVEHWMIQYDYIASNPAALKEYYVPGSSGRLNGNPGYADIANPITGEMFEIKPGNPTGQSAGAAEIQLYVDQANALCPLNAGGGWSAGGSYSTRYLPDPKNPSNVLQATLSSAGVIVYSSLPQDGLLQPNPVILPDNLLDKLKKLFIQIKNNPTNLPQQIIIFVRQNPRIIPYLKGAAAGVIIGTILEDIVSNGPGILDDWQSFLIARTLWRVANGIIII